MSLGRRLRVGASCAAFEIAHETIVGDGIVLSGDDDQMKAASFSDCSVVWLGCITDANSGDVKRQHGLRCHTHGIGDADRSFIDRAADDGSDQLWLLARDGSQTLDIRQCGHSARRDHG